jgi:DNA polymerase-1
VANPERLILVDGSSLIYRAYYAIPANFSTSQGLPTNAIYGFATMFRKVLSGRTPSKGAVVFDAPGKTFRAEKYPEYKAHRPRMDQELRVQLPWIDKVVEAHKFPLLRVPGYEADDIIATLSSQATAAGMEVHIISGDKDFAQLISESVRMVDTLRDIVYNPELVRKKWGVPPEQFVDWQAMVGDKVDNIPGVPGVGAKGAAGLLERFSDLDTILASTDQLKGRQQKNLVEFADQARLSRELATLDREAKLPLGLADLDLVAPEQGDLNALYKELEFFSLLSADEAKDEQGADEDCEYTATKGLKDLKKLVGALPKDQPVGILPLFDPDSPVRNPLAALALCWQAKSATVIPLEGPEGLGESALKILRPWLEDSARAKICHNAKELWICLQRKGIELSGVVGDTILESFLIDPTKLIPHRIDQVVKEYLHRTVPPVKQVLGSGKKRKSFCELSSEDYREWSGQQVDAIFQSWPIIRERLEEEAQLDYFTKIDLPLSWVLGAMEIEGILVDPKSLASMGKEFAERLAGYEAEIYEHAGRSFNVASPKQLSAVLFDELKLPVIKRTKTGYSTKAEVLERLVPKHPIAAVLLQHRKLAKLINTYTDVLQREVNPATGRVHTTFQQTAGATGRLITTEPDLQRTPIKTPEGRRIRETFVAARGNRLVSADWSQIELRLLAHFTGDELLVESFQKNLDVHARTASQLFGCALNKVTREQRGVGKLVNFSTIYGQGSTALGQILGVPKKEAQGYIEGYFEAYSGVRTWLDETMEQAHESGFVTTLLGRRRYIPELSSNSFMIRQAGERIAANTPIQASAADICKVAMIDIDKEMRARKLKARMLLQIHDELVFEVPKAEVEELSALVKDKMESVHALDVPLVADVGVGMNWAEAH